MTQVVLIRPGATVYDEQNRVQGVLDVPLSDRGRAEVADLADRLAGNGVALAALYCGPGESVVRTAETVARALGLRVRRLEELRNLDQGLWQGLQIDEIRRRNLKLFRQWQEDPRTVCPPLGETVESALTASGRCSSPSCASIATRPSAWSSPSRSLASSPVTSVATRTSSCSTPSPPVASNGSRSSPMPGPTDPPPEPGPARLPAVMDPALIEHRPSARPMEQLTTPLADVRSPAPTGSPDGASSPMAAKRDASPGIRAGLDRGQEGPRRGLDALRGLRGDPLPQGGRAQPRASAPQCDHHFTVPARDRIAQLLDTDTFEEWFADLRPGDPLGFNDRRPYPDRVVAEQAADRPDRGRPRRPGVHQGHPPRLRPHRLRLHHGEHGLGRRREADPGHRAGDPPEASRWSSSPAPAAAPGCTRGSSP